MAQKPQTNNMANRPPTRSNNNDDLGTINASEVVLQLRRADEDPEWIKSKDLSKLTMNQQVAFYKKQLAQEHDLPLIAWKPQKPEHLNYTEELHLVWLVPLADGKIKHTGEIYGPPRDANDICMSACEWARQNQPRILAHGRLRSGINIMRLHQMIVNNSNIFAKGYMLGNHSIFTSYSLYSHLRALQSYYAADALKPKLAWHTVRRINRIQHTSGDWSLSSVSSDDSNSKDSVNMFDLDKSDNGSNNGMSSNITQSMAKLSLKDNNNSDNDNMMTKRSNNNNNNMPDIGSLGMVIINKDSSMMDDNKEESGNQARASSDDDAKELIWHNARGIQTAINCLSKENMDIKLKLTALIEEVLSLSAMIVEIDDNSNTNKSSNRNSNNTM